MGAATLTARFTTHAQIQYGARMTHEPLAEQEYEKLADTQLRKLEKALMDFDPDEIEADLSMGVLTLTVGSQGVAKAGHKVVINSHRAARQIWMAAQRTAWHFDVDPASKQWKTKDAELVGALEQVLTSLLKRKIALPLAR